MRQTFRGTKKSCYSSVTAKSQNTKVAIIDLLPTYFMFTLVHNMLQHRLDSSKILWFDLGSRLTDLRFDPLLCLALKPHYGNALRGCSSAIKGPLIVSQLQTLSLTESNIFPASILRLSSGNPSHTNAVVLPLLHIYVHGNQTT